MDKRAAENKWVIDGLKEAEAQMDTAERVSTTQEALVYENAIEDAFDAYSTLLHRNIYDHVTIMMDLAGRYNKVFLGLDAMEYAHGIDLGYAGLFKGMIRIPAAGASELLLCDLPEDARLNRRDPQVQNRIRNDFYARAKNSYRTVQDIRELKDALSRTGHDFDKLETDFYGRLYAKLPEKQKGISWEDAIAAAKGPGTAEHRMLRAYTAFSEFTSGHVKALQRMLSAMDSAKNVGLDAQVEQSLRQWLGGNHMDFSFCKHPAEGTLPELALGIPGGSITCFPDEVMICSEKNRILTGTVTVPYAAGRDQFCKILSHADPITDDLVFHIPEYLTRAGNMLDVLEPEFIHAVAEVAKPYLDLASQEAEQDRER